MIKDTLSGTWVKIEKAQGYELSPEMQMILCRDYIKELFHTVLFEDEINHVNFDVYARLFIDNEVLDYFFDCEYDPVIDSDDYHKLVQTILTVPLTERMKNIIFNAVSKAIDAQYNLKVTQFRNREAERDIENLFCELRFFA